MFSSRRSTPAPESSSRARQRFPRRQRLTRGTDLRAVARDGKRLRTALFDVRVVFGKDQQHRVGFVVPKHGHSAVRRNQLKRRMRELARLGLLSGPTGAAPAGMDIVMRALPGAYRASIEQLRAEFDALRGRLSRHRQTPV